MPPPNSSSSSSGDSSSSSDDEKQLNNNKAVKSQTLNKQHKKIKEPSSSSSESEGNEETSDDEEDGPSESVKPTQSKSGDSDSDSDSDSGSEPEPEPALPVTPVSSKPLTSSSNDDTKSPSAFQRIWSLDDEILILKRLLKHKEKHGSIKLDTATVEKIHSSVAKSLSIKVSEAQLCSKIRVLRAKFINLFRKGKGSKLARPHAKAVYDLSGKVWGDKVAEDSEAGGKSSKKKKADGDEVKVKGGEKKANENEVKVERGEKKANENEVTVYGGEEKANEREKGVRRKFIFLEAVVDVIGDRTAGKALKRVKPEQAMDMEEELKEVWAPQIEHQITKWELLRRSFEMVQEGWERSSTA